MPELSHDPNNDDERDLTPDERERLGRTLESLRGAIPKIEADTSALTGLFTIPESVVRSTRISEGMLEQIVASMEPYVRMSEVAQELMKPVIDAQSAWAEQLSVINSDALKSLQVLPDMDSVISQIGRNADFGEPYARFSEQVTRWHAEVVQPFAERAQEIHRALFAENLRDIEDLTLAEVEEVVMVDGIALYGIPRTSIAEEIIRADGTEARLEVIDREWESIVEDCRALLDRCRHSEAAEWVLAANAAIDALEGGHDAAAQALIAALIDTVVTEHMVDKTTKARFTPDRKGNRTTEEYDKLGAHEFQALAPIWQTYRHFHAEDGDEIPAEFSRHATAHTVSSVQYTRRNAVQGLMVACSLIHFMDEQAALLEDEAA